MENVMSKTYIDIIETLNGVSMTALQQSSTLLRNNIRCIDVSCNDSNVNIECKHEARRS